MSKKNYLFIAAVLIVALFFAIPMYNAWLFGFIMQPSVRYADQFRYLDPNDRKMMKYGSSYGMYLQSVSVFQRSNIQDPLILLPPVGYLKDMGCVNIEVCEPAEFYYYTGYKAVLFTSPGVEQATWAMVPYKKDVMLRKIHSKEDLDNLLNTYKNYKPK